jgi:photosystem II stability/assembly factor-like uncharacterized protein
MGCSDEPQNQIIKNNSEQIPGDFMFIQRTYPSGELNTAAYGKAIQWKKAKLKSKSTNDIWEFSGPVNIGGRITDIEIPSNLPKTYYVGAASGGIFKTTDGGMNWTPIFDDQAFLSIGDIEISRNDNELVWVGTGEVNAGGGSLAYDGDGIYLSKDGGLTWENKGLTHVGGISKILIDPNDDNTVFAATMGKLFKNNNERGVYRTTNGGENWEQILFVSDSTGVIDMAIHPSIGDIVYAATWERIRRPNKRQYGGVTSGLYRSLDGGDTWAEMLNGLPFDPLDKGRISIDISRSNPEVLYARYADATGNIQGVYKTSNAGDSWNRVNSSQLTNVGFHWWFRGLYVDPTNENILYNVDYIVEKSTDGGNSWFVAFPGVHVDQHALAFNSQNDGELLLGNDGGFYKSSTNGTSYSKNFNLPISQFYRIHVDVQNGDKIYGGTQDNSTIRTSSGSLDDWEIIFGGDGFQPLVDHTNTNIIYALSQRGYLGKSTNNGFTFNPALSGINSSDRNNWDTPITFDPTNSNILYFGTHRIYKSENGAANWNAISPDLTKGPYPGNLGFGTITSIDVSPLDSDLIFVGTDDGNVWRSVNGGGIWERISTTLPDRWVTKVLADRADINAVYVCFSGFRFGEDNGHVYKSADLGDSWQDIGTALPDIPLNDIVKDRFGNIFLATDIGVLSSSDEGENWQVSGVNLPAVVVTDMHLDEPNELLYIATYGRSTYRLDISGDISSIENEEFASNLKMYPNPSNNFTNLVLPQNIDQAELVIYDSMGRKVRTEVLKSSTTRVSLIDLMKGFYFVSISDGKVKTTKKLVIN